MHIDIQNSYKFSPRLILANEFFRDFAKTNFHEWRNMLIFASTNFDEWARDKKIFKSIK